MEYLKQLFIWQASYSGLLLEVFLILLIYLGYKYFPRKGIFIIFELFFEKAYEFFEEILGLEEKKWIKLYIVSMFFIIVLSNLMGFFIDFLVPIVGYTQENEPILEHFIKIPTADINFNIAMAIVGVIIVIIEQFKTLGFGKALYEYIPIFGKDLIPYEKGKFPKFLDYFLFSLVKIFDIIISLFLGLLDIVGHFAKIVSLSFRLFGNMTSGGILLAMLFSAIAILTNSLIGIDFPIIGPVILYLQGLLVAFIQALVFPLLIAIFIKVAKIS